MKDLHRVSLVGPRDGKPQKGLATWMDFVHADETRAKELGAIMARRLTDRTGHPISFHVEPVSLVERNEDELLEHIDEIVACYPGSADQPRQEIVATMSCVNDASWSSDVPPLEEAGLAARFVEDLLDQHGIDLDDWIVLSERFPLQDENSEEREAHVVLSLPAADADLLLANRAAVDEYLLRIVERPASTSLYDDDGRMEEIADDAEDAALNAWGPLGAPVRRPNPYPEGSEEAEYWNRTFANAYARENAK